jgi:hypothetical protein
VEIWKEADGRLRAIRDGVAVDPSTIWTWCCLNPVTYEASVAVAETGEAWPEDVPSVNGDRVGARVGSARANACDTAGPGDAAVPPLPEVLPGPGGMLSAATGGGGSGARAAKLPACAVDGGGGSGYGVAASLLTKAAVSTGAEGSTG